MASHESSSLSPRAALVHRLASSLGFALVGIAPAEPTQHGAEFRAWLDAGKHGDMDYLARYAEVALDPRHIVPEAQAIICVMDRYAEKGPAGAEAVAAAVAETEKAAEISNPEPDTRHPKPETRSSLARIARYAQGDDYHRVMKNRLHQLADALREKFPEHLFRTTVDTAPLLEREHAARAGLGWIGKHTLLIHPQLGSWFLLGEIITTLPLETSADGGYAPPLVEPADHCGSCTRCIDACPTQCISPYSVDASRCISYLTLEHRGEIDPSLHPMMRDWLAGCDVCQEVCPFNQVSPRESEREMQNTKAIHRAYEPRLRSLPLLDVLNWSESQRREAVVRSALKRIKLEMFKRNAIIAAGNDLASNHDDESDPLRKRIEALAADAEESEMVRVTAMQVLDRLQQ